MKPAVAVPREMRMKLTEAQVTKQCIDMLKAEGWMCIRLNSGLFQRPGGNVRVRIGEPGIPDWVCFRRTDYFFLELKSSVGRLSKDQRNWFMDVAHKRHLRAWVVGEISDLKDLMREEGLCQ